MDIWIYRSDDAPLPQAAMAVIVEKGKRLPVVFYAPTGEDARANAEAFWRAELDKAAALNGVRKRGRKPKSALAEMGVDLGTEDDGDPI